MKRENEIAHAFLVEASTDLHAAQVLIQQEGYAPTITHCQQAVEKTLKAVLATQGIFSATHEVSEPFRATFPDLPDKGLSIVDR